MTLSAGTRLGSYEIVAPLGAGGMGEVYRAHDPALGRDVAIKVLPAAASADPDRLRRFEQEARSAGLLNHPNIFSIYGFGEHDGAPYVVSELLEGSTLRDRMAGTALSPRRAIDYGLQVAQGLAAAHEKGIVHRDLKPENLFVTDDGRVKILDFGLAKLTQPEGPSAGATAAPTVTGRTEPGVVLGTAGYMSPEQVRGLPADNRSDIFSFGAVLYEMLTGRRAFRGDSAIEAMSAILKEDPPELSETNKNLPPALERIVRHCLEKSPQLRIQSARDLAYDLEALSGVSGTTVAPRVAARGSRRALTVALTAAAALALVALGLLIGRRLLSAGGPSAAENVRYRRLTFRRGNVVFARFAPDGQTFVYGAAWDDKPAEIFLGRVDGHDSRALGIPNASLLAISKEGELAVALKKTNLFGTVGSGTLARVPMTGGSPRELVEAVSAAEWNPAGTDLAVLSGWPVRLRPCRKDPSARTGTRHLDHPRHQPRGRRSHRARGGAGSDLLPPRGRSRRARSVVAGVFPAFLHLERRIDSALLGAAGGRRREGVGLSSAHRRIARLPTRGRPGPGPFSRRKVGARGRADSIAPVRPAPDGGRPGPTARHGIAHSFRGGISARRARRVRRKRVGTRLTRPCSGSGGRKTTSLHRRRHHRRCGRLPGRTAPRAVRSERGREDLSGRRRTAASGRGSRAGRRADPVERGRPRSLSHEAGGASRAHRAAGPRHGQEGELEAAPAGGPRP